MTQGQGGFEIKEVRLLLEQELMHVYIRLGELWVDSGQIPILGIKGWHHGVFPSDGAVIDLLAQILQGTEYIEWPQDDPQANYTENKVGHVEYEPRD